MEKVQLANSLKSLLLGWLDQVQYYITHKGLQKAIDVTRGIRQGCVASPFLWLMWTAEFLTQLESQTSTEWVRKHLSIYADDIISQWDIMTPGGFTTAITEIGKLLDLLERMHLSVSIQKSAVLLKLVGTARKELLKRHTCRQGNQTCLIVPREDGRITYLPLAKQHKYLGTMLSYQNPEDATLQYRIKCGQTAFFRLIKFLGKSHVLPLRMKVRLWVQCVQCSYLYGLYAAGLTSQGCRKLCTRILLDLRRLSGCWAHLTHVTNSDLCSRLKLREPIDDLQVRWHHHITKHLAERQKLEPDDFLLTFDEYETMRNHVNRHHSELDLKHSYQPLRDSINGLPQCRHCQLKLSSRNMLRQHIEKNWCYAFDPSAQVQQPLCQQGATRALLRAQDWNALLADRDLCRSLVHHCGICQHWCAQSQSLGAHLKKQHGNLYTPSMTLRPGHSARCVLRKSISNAPAQWSCR